MNSLLAVFAHPDDESLAAGGLLARHTAQGGRATVLTCTWERTTTRGAELAAATRILGCEPPRFLGYADARVAESASHLGRFVDAPLDDLVRRMVGEIRQVRPGTVVTHDAVGNLSGHPDHVQAHRVTMLAFQAAGLDVLYPDAGSAWQPGSILLATHPRSAVTALGDVLGERRGAYTVPDDRVDHRIDVTPWLDAKVEAILAHLSEAQRGALPGLVDRLSADQRTRLLGTEWYTEHRAPGTPRR